MLGTSPSHQDSPREPVHVPLFNGPVSLRQTYVPLRAYYLEREGTARREPLNQSLERRAKGKHIVVALDEEIAGWLEDSAESGAIRLVTGVPGSGKTSFCTMLAARLKISGRFRPLYIPLYEVILDENLDASLVDVLAQTGRLSEDELLSAESNVPVVLILDGLDELASPGGERCRAVRWLVEQTQRLVEELDGTESTLRVLLTGDEVFAERAEDEFLIGKRVLHLLPFCVPIPDRQRFGDPSGLLKRDQHAEWWRLFAATTGLDEPEAAVSPNRAYDITPRLPLHEYVTALTIMRGMRAYPEGDNTNAQFQQLFDLIAEDIAKRGSQGAQSTELSKDGVMRLLEEAAFAAWQGNRRTVRIESLRQLGVENGSQARVHAALEAIASVDGLTVCHLCEPSERHTNGPILEFAHQCFAEYLTARWMVRAIRRFASESAQAAGAGWQRDCLRRWIELCGQTVLDASVLGFLRNEVLLQSDSAVSWQDTLVDLLEYALYNSVPVDDLVPQATHSAEVRRVRNAEEALLAALNACARATNRVSKIKWPTKRAASEWLSRLQGQRVGVGNALALDCLSLIDFADSVFEVRDLLGSDMERSVLTESWLTWANMTAARMNHVHLEDAHLEGAHLSEAQLKGAHLERAKLSEAHLREARLEGAHLEAADLSGAHLREVHMEVADLRGARLVGAHFRGAWLTEADLREANLTRARLLDSRLDGADLRGANLVGANLSGAVLVDADLRGLSPDVPLEATAEQLSKASSLCAARMDPALRTVMEERYAQVLQAPQL